MKLNADAAKVGRHPGLVLSICPVSEVKTIQCDSKRGVRCNPDAARSLDQAVLSDHEMRSAALPGARSAHSTPPFHSHQLPQISTLCREGQARLGNSFDFLTLAWRYLYTTCVRPVPEGPREVQLNDLGSGPLNDHEIVKNLRDDNPTYVLHPAGRKYKRSTGRH